MLSLVHTAMCSDAVISQVNKPGPHKFSASFLLRLYIRIYSPTYAVPFQIQSAHITVATERHRFLQYFLHLSQGTVPQIHPPLNIRTNLE